MKGYDQSIELNEHIFVQCVAVVKHAFSSGLQVSRFRQFQKLIAEVRQNDFQQAAKEKNDSNWYRQVGNRGKKLSEMMGF